MTKNRPIGLSTPEATTRRGATADNVQMPAPHAPARSRLRAPLVLFVVAFVIYALTVGWDLSIDVWTAHYAAWHITQTGQGWLDVAALPMLDQHPLRHVWIVETADGREAIGRAPGVVAAAVPAYWLLGLDQFSVIPGSVTAALLTAWTLVLLFQTLRSRMDDKPALLAALLFGFTTPVWTISANGMWPHTLTVLGIVGMAWAADRERWWLVGLFGGIALWGRIHVAVVCAVLGLLVALWRRKPTIAVAAGLASGALLTLMTVWTRWMYGSWDPTAAYRMGDFTGYAGQNRLDVLNHLGFWLAPDRGILVWTPLVLVLMAALVRNWRDLPDWSRALVFGGIAYTLLQGTFNRFSGGDTFYGYRLGLEILACLAPAMALSAHRMGHVARRLFVPVAVVQFAMIFPGAVSNTYFTSADEVWTRNTIVVALMSEPLLFAPALVGSLAVGVLLARIWANPGLEPRRERREPKAFSSSASQ